ncbi:uncharacterized protein LOC114280358 [Camellia sinensis]|uniref:uncharacterized protein LOC114280358 n=1 Tax=Camellia sinensis TaxID=4442 RepID=UPI001035A078|nr:uncharacterized protein LOC114280358 [Camellia sinensis]
MLDQAKAAKAAQNLAEEKAKLADDEAEVARADLVVAKAKAANIEAKLQEALDSKEVEVKAADEKAFEEGQAAIRNQYKQQVNLACNRGYYLGWTATLAKAAKAAQNLAEGKAKLVDDEAEVARANLVVAKAKAADIEAKLQEALDSKEVEVKAADEKAFEEGQAAIHNQYKQQVNMACNREPKDSSDEAGKDDTEDGEADEVEEEGATDAEFPTLNEQIDLT